ncbi:helix-turn-helix transcriptional regulator [Tropicimonas sp.]|uniref:helix-turn-helix transcriptional regulator n=1 Tax=Tropicimonas sp. TaxID=2067044 RepID=UPI003A843752
MYRHESQFETVSALELGASPFEVVVVGNGMHYSAQTCGHIQTEFHVRCIRIGDIDRISAAIGDGAERLRLLIVDQKFSDDLLFRPETYRAATGPAPLALAYRDAGLAGDFLKRWRKAAAGPIGFLPTQVSVDVWLSTMRLLLNRHLVLPVELLSRDAAAGIAGEGPPGRPEPAPRPAPALQKLYDLTGREREVLGLIARGESNKRIASNLDITEHTVKLHVHNLVKKLGVPNRTAAASLFVEVSR